MNKNSFIVSTNFRCKHIPKRYLQTRKSQSKINSKFSNFMYEKTSTNFENNYNRRYSTLVHKKTENLPKKTHQLLSKKYTIKDCSRQNFDCLNRCTF